MFDKERTTLPKIFQLYYNYNLKGKQCQDVLKKIFLCRKQKKKGENKK